MAGDEFTLEARADAEALPHLHDLIARARATHPEADEEAFMMLRTAALEIAGNVVQHGRPPGQVRWSFTLRVGRDVLEGVLADDGEEYECDLSAVMPDPWAESGRGIPLAQAALDELDYTRHDGKNVWTMRRRVAA